MTSNDKDLDMWTDTDVYYWVFKIDVGEAHALAMWQEAIDGKILSAMRKRQLHDICKTLSREKTSTLWQEIKKLQKQGRKSSLFGKKGKPTPITPDYPGDDSFDSDSDFDSLEEDEVDVNTEDMNHTSLPDLLKERLKEFKAQQEEVIDTNSHIWISFLYDRNFVINNTKKRKKKQQLYLNFTTAGVFARRLA